MQTCFSWSQVFIHVFVCLFCLSWVFGTYPFDVHFVPLLRTMSWWQYVTKNTVTDITSVDWATRSVNEGEVIRRKGWPTTHKRTRAQKKLPSWKTVYSNTHSNCWHSSWFVIVVNNSVFWIIIAFLCFCHCFDFKCNWVIKTNIVSNRKKRQSNRKFLSQLDDLDQDINFSHFASENKKIL